MKWKDVGGHHIRTLVDLLTQEGPSTVTGLTDDEKNDLVAYLRTL